jgi:phosphate transport system permease protein
VILLAALLIDVVTDAAGWISGRINRDPRMFMLYLETVPGFEETAKETDPKLFRKIDAKLKARQRSAERDDYELTDDELEEIKLDTLHSEYSKDELIYTKFDMHPTPVQRMTVLKSILADVIAAFPSRHPTKAGFKSAVVGSMWLLGLTALISIPIGIAAAVYLEEYAAKNRLSRFIELNISNLAGVPSIVYGILGLALFVRWLGWGRSVLAGAATMSLLILPVIIIAAREAIKAVPSSIRQGAFALGATRWQVVSQHVLPSAVPGILTGIILSMSRAIGETAPMIMIGALSYVAFVPRGPMDDFTVLPIQIFNWVSFPQKEFHMLAACGILLLLAVLLTMNALAIIIRFRAQRNLKW